MSTFDTIKKCSRCSLCTNQAPIFDRLAVEGVFWVGLSAKMRKSADETPLDSSTRSGSLIDSVSRICEERPMYRTNLVKCVPLDDVGKIRYPSVREMNACVCNLDAEIRELSPRIVFLLGKKVTDAVAHHYSTKFPGWNGFTYSTRAVEGTLFASIHHPSYISVYKRRYIDDYVASLAAISEQACK